MRTIRSYSIISGFLIVLLVFFKTLTSGLYSSPVGTLSTGTEYFDSSVYDINEDFYQVHDSKSTDFSYKAKLKLKIKKRFRARYIDYFFCPIVKSPDSYNSICLVSYFHRHDYLSSRFHFSFKLRGPPVQPVS